MLFQLLIVFVWTEPDLVSAVVYYPHFLLQLFFQKVGLVTLACLISAFHTLKFI